MSSAPASSSPSEAGPGGRGLLLRVSGLPGAGKTTLLALAAGHAGVRPISRDLIRGAMFPGGGRPTARETSLAFDAMIAVAEGPLRRGERVSLDGCCFARPAQRDRARELARATGAVLVGVHLSLPLAVAVRRVRESGDHPAADRDAPLVARVAGYFAPPDPSDVVLDATAPPDQLWAALESLLAAATGAGAGPRAAGPGGPG